MALDFAFDDADRGLLERAAEFTRERIEPEVESWEVSCHVPESVLRECAAEFAGLLVPLDYGGLGASTATAASVLATLARGDLSFAFSMVVHANLANAIARYGDDALRRRYLSALLRGELMGAFCLTEPDTGTDAASIQTRVVRAGERIVLQGAKAWVTNAAFADLFCVFVRDPSTGDRARPASQIAAYLVDGDSPGLIRTERYPLLGSHLMGTAGIDLADCTVACEAQLFAPGAGFQAAMRGIDLARVLLSAMCCAVLAQALDAAITYLKARHAFGKPLASFQGLQFQVADIATQLEAARQLTRHAIARLECGESATLAAAHAKKFSSLAAVQGIGVAMRLMGAAGLKRDRPFARQLANANTTLFLDGTTEVQNIVIARELGAL